MHGNDIMCFRHASQAHQDQKSWTQIAEEQSTAKRTYDLFGISFDPSVFKAKREVITSCSVYNNKPAEYKTYNVMIDLSGNKLFPIQYRKQTNFCT